MSARSTYHVSMFVRWTFLLPIVAAILKNDIALAIEGLMLIIAIISRVIVLVLLHCLQLVEELFFLELA